MINELVGEMKAAAATLLTAAAAVENGDLATAEIGVEGAIFRVESLLGRLRQFKLAPDPWPTDPGKGGSRSKEI